MVRFSRVGLATVPMCHPSVIRSRQLMRHDGGNTLKSQDNHEWLRTLPRNPMECGSAIPCKAVGHPSLESCRPRRSTMGNDLWFVAGDERAVQGKLALHAAQVGYPALQGAGR